MKNTGLFKFGNDIKTVFKSIIDKRTPWYVKAAGIIGLAYIVLPFDFLHDYIPVLGWTDDVTAAGLIIWFILALIPKEVLEDNKQKKEIAGEITEAKKPEDK
ncbi:MAG TPA: DUF1232 domain-containing protein [Candidatus Goldiibacteriota bacterium]|nr:DUF1232 domain-containing protein [Candidatus Goldiibacteriota bacterium]